MKTQVWLVTIGMLTLVACSSNTSKKVESANDDWHRMTAIDRELRADGVNVLALEESASTISTMERGLLRHVRDLLGEFASRGAGLLQTAQRRDVQVTSGTDLAKIERGIRNAERLKFKADETLRGEGSACADENSGPAASVPKFAAQSYLGNLEPEILRRLDVHHADVSRVPGSCRLFRVTFPTKRDDGELTVMVNWNQVLPDQSDRHIVRR